jgi:hypothetical protein
MPGKPRHAQKKQPHHSKKSKAKQRQQSISLQQHVAAQTPGQATVIETPSPSKPTTSPAKTRTLQHPYVTSELRRISILAGIIIVILIILAIILP